MMGSTSPGITISDSTAMTIEFLRARLLSERSVSRSARQRADQLAKRVVELEEQLRFMIVQRKKAEKVASQVLAILEIQGICDFPEVTDSSSDRDDGDSGSKGNDVKGDVASTASRAEKNEEDGFSGSEVEAPPSNGRRLSWKGRSASTEFHEKQKSEQVRQRQGCISFASINNSTERHYLGKSCRKIKRKETRSSEENGPDKPIFNSLGEQNQQPDLPRESSGNGRGEVFPHSSLASSIEDEIKQTDTDLYANGGDRDEEMERVLEQQAQLIGQYQAEENAQKEWEDKYNENESFILDFHKPEDQCRAAETCREAKAEVTKFAEDNSYYAEEAKSSAEDEPTSRLNSTPPTAGTPHATDPEKGGNLQQDLISVQQCDTILVQDSESSSHEITIPAQEIKSICANSPADARNTLSLHSHGYGVIEIPSDETPYSDNPSIKMSQWPIQESQNQLQRNRLGGVLQALQHAKASLGQLGKNPLSNQGTLVTTTPMDTRARAFKYSGNSEMPISTTGLFRLPTDSFPEPGFSRPKLDSSGLSLAAAYPDLGYMNVDTTRRQYFDPYSHLAMEKRQIWDAPSRSGATRRDGMYIGDQYLYGGDPAFPYIRRL